MWAKGSQRESGVQSARFFIVDLEGRASVAQLCCLGPEVSNKKNCCCKPIIFVGGWLRAVRCHAEIQRSFFGKDGRMNSLWRRQGKFLICTYTPRCSCVCLQFIHGVTPTMRVPAMYAGQMSNMATTLGEIRCQLFAQVICLLAVATLFA